MASTTAQTTLSGKTDGDGVTIDFTDAKARVTMVLVPSGTITGGLVQMQASQDNTNWVVVAVLDPAIRAPQFHSNSLGAFRYWRGVVVSAVTGGGSVSATLMEADR